MIKNDIYESGEMYLETIFRLKRKQQIVRSVDVVNNLNYAKSSVSRGINILKDSGFITVDNDGVIEFTELGKDKAEAVFERHITITKFLMKTLELDKETAEADACRIEHVISDETFNAIKAKTK